MRNTLLHRLVVLITIILNAYCAYAAKRVQIDNLFYLLDTKNKNAEVTFKSCKNKKLYNQNWDVSSINIPSEVLYKGVSYKVTRIGDNAFSDCSKLVYVNMPNDIISIGQQAFGGCDMLRQVVLSNINLPDRLQTIGVCSFYGCKSIKSIHISSTIYSIGMDAFKHCDSLRSVTLNSNNIVSKDYNAKFTLRDVFGEQVSAYTLGAEVTKIGSYAFAYSNELSIVDLPYSISEIGQFAFAGCRKLQQFQIPGKISKINDYTFYSCSSLTSVDIPEGIQHIGFNAFCSCEKLKDIFIPNSVIYIDAWAFGWCKNLTSVCIGNSVTYVGSSAFKGCNSIKEFTYPKGLNLSSADLASYIKRNVYDRSHSPRPKEINPPLLSLIEESLKFHDASNDNSINAEESCSIKFIIQNKGKGAAYDCKIKVQLYGTKKGLNIQTTDIPVIPAGQLQEVNIPITTNIDTEDGIVTFSIEIIEPNGWGVAPFEISVATKAYDPPLLQVVDYNVASSSGKIHRMEPFTLTFNVQNTRYGDAEDVSVKIKLPNNVFIMDGYSELTYPVIKSGDVKSVQIVLAANNNYKNTNIPISIEVKEKHKLFAENKDFFLTLNQPTSSSIQITAKEEQKEHKEIKLAMLKSDVDRNIPISPIKNDNTFVLIIANEHYSQEATVPFALNDGNIFKEYCIKTLGIGEKHIKYLTDATGNQIKASINWLANLTEAFDNPQIIVYYAGHGIPDESNKSSYILPVDGSGTDVTTGYKLDDLYITLGNLPASHITVFMDACFSGSKREDGMLASARGVALKAKSGVPQGNMVVFSAAQGDETAYPNREQQHGLFTYYLLKKLQETEGNVALKDLGDYITKQVSQQSILVNNKKQTPCVTPSASLGTEWQNWKLK